MIDPGLVRDAERAHASVIWLVGSGGIAVTALLIAIAWLLVVRPPAAERPPAASPLIERGLIKVGP